MQSLLERKSPNCSSCKDCKSTLVEHGNELHTEYLRLVLCGGLKIPSLELLHYTTSVFGILQRVEEMVRKSNVGERVACEHLLKIFGPTPEFVCETHNEKAGQVANRIITNIYFNNAQKESKDAKRKDSLQGSKISQLEKR